MELRVVGTEIDQADALLLYQLLDGIIVVALVLAAQDEDGGRGHAFQCIPACIHVGGLRVIDILYASHTCYFLQSMLHPLEVAQALAQVLVLDAAQVGSNACGQAVVHVVLAAQAQRLLLHIEWCGALDDVLPVCDIADHSILLQDAEGTHLGAYAVLCQFALDDGVVSPVHEGVILRLVLHDAHLGVGVVLHRIVVAV